MNDADMMKQVALVKQLRDRGTANGGSAFGQLLPGHDQPQQVAGPGTPAGTPGLPETQLPVPGQTPPQQPPIVLPASEMNAALAGGM